MLTLLPSIEEPRGLLINQGIPGGIRVIKASPHLTTVATLFSHLGRSFELVPCDNQPSHQLSATMRRLGNPLTHILSQPYVEQTRGALLPY